MDSPVRKNLQLILRCLMSLSQFVQKSWHKTQKTQKLQKHKFDKTGEFMQIYFQVFSSIFMNTQWKNEIQRPNVSHFRAFDMKNLQYDIKVPQKIYRRATIHCWAWYDFFTEQTLRINWSLNKTEESITDYKAA